MPNSFAFHMYLSDVSYSTYFYGIESWLHLVSSIRCLIFWAPDPYLINSGTTTCPHVAQGTRRIVNAQKIQ